MRAPNVTAGPTARWLLAALAVVVGALLGTWAGPGVWSLLEDVGVVAVPACNDVVVTTVQAMCAQPRSMFVVALGTAAVCAAAGGIVARRLLWGAPAGSARRDASG